MDVSAKSAYTRSSELLPRLGQALCLLTAFALGTPSQANSCQADSALPASTNPEFYPNLAEYPQAANSKSAKTLSKIAQVRNLSTVQAASSIPVQLSGVVTAVPGYRNSFFFQDQTAGISVDRTDDTIVHRGDHVLVDGTSGPGLFAPVVLASHVRVLGREPPPQAPRMTLGDLFGGVQDSQWIELRGVVRSATLAKLFGHPTLLLVLKLDGGSVNLQVQDFHSIDRDRIVDSVIRVRGVCASSGNEKRQFVGSTVFVPTQHEIEIEQSGLQDPFAAHMEPIEDVLKFGQWQRRIKVAGTVTYQLPGQAIYLQDGDNGIRVESKSTEIVTPGARVEAVGFPALREYAPLLEDGLYRVLDRSGPSAKVQPKRVDADSIITRHDGNNRAHYDQQLVQVEARLMEDHVQGGQNVWIMRPESHHEGSHEGNQNSNSNPIEFDARIPIAAPNGAVSPSVGSLLLLTGICTVHVGSTLNPVTFTILMRSPDDIAVIKPGPWWTPAHGLATLSVMAGILLLVLLWVTVLRIRVKQDTRVIRESGERFRYLSEHDSLTGLMNRPAIVIALDHQILRGAREQHTVTVVLADIDYFKRVNDLYGHLAGDAALGRFTEAISTCIRPYDDVGRYGGEEFLMVLAGVPEEDVEDRLNAMHEAMSNLAVHYRQYSFNITCSLGAVVIANCRAGMNHDSLLAAADRALYQAKQAGRNQVVVHREQVVEAGG